MSILDAFESRVESLFSGALARAFSADVQPVELAAALQREMDDRAATLDEYRTLTPNAFQIDLATSDYERLAGHLTTLSAELASLVTEHADVQRFTLVGPVSINFARDEALDTGVFRVRSASRQGAAAAPAAGSPRLVFSNGEQVPLVQAVTSLGRGKDANIHVDDVGASRAHCEIVLGQPIRIRDLGSTNGTYVDGSRIAEAELTDGSRITLGTTTLTLKLL